MKHRTILILLIILNISLIGALLFVLFFDREGSSKEKSYIPDSNIEIIIDTEDEDDKGEEVIEEEEYILKESA